MLEWKILTVSGVGETPILVRERMIDPDRNRNLRSPDSGLEKLTVLAVDDDALIVDFYSRILEDEYEVKVACDGLEAWSMIDHSIDIVLLDRSMPSITGDELLEMIRDKECDILVAMMTGREPGLEVIDLDFDDYLVKPITRKQLRDTVHDLAQRTRFSAPVQELFALDAKIDILKSAIDADTLESNPTYADLYSRRRDLEWELWNELQEYIEDRSDPSSRIGTYGKKREYLQRPGKESWTRGNDGQRSSDDQ